MPLRNNGHRRQFAILQGKKKTFIVPLTEKIIVKRGSAKLLGTSENFYDVTPPPLPTGWDLSFSTGSEAKKASININYMGRKAHVNLDRDIFENKDVPEGIKVFIVFHEMGHLIYGPNENKCDKFARQHAMRVGVTPYLCYVAIRAYMPDHYAGRVIDMGNDIAANKNWKNDIQ